MRFSVEQFDTNTRWFIAQNNARMPFFMAGAFGEGNPSFLFAQKQQLDLSFVLFPLPGFCSSHCVAEIEKLTAVEKVAFNPFALDQSGDEGGVRSKLNGVSGCWLFSLFCLSHLG